MAGGFFHETRQNANISAAKLDAQSAQRTAENAQETLRRMEKRLDHLLLVNRALWALIRDRTGLTEAELSASFEQASNASSVKMAELCGSCNRPMGKGHAKCMYCGSERVFQSVFDML